MDTSSVPEVIHSVVLDQFVCHPLNEMTTAGCPLLLSCPLISTPSTPLTPQIPLTCRCSDIPYTAQYTPDLLNSLGLRSFTSLKFQMTKHYWWKILIKKIQPLLGVNEDLDISLFFLYFPVFSSYRHATNVTHVSVGKDSLNEAQQGNRLRPSGHKHSARNQEPLRTL